MEDQSNNEGRGFGKAAVLKTAGLAIALGAITWLLAPMLLPFKPPSDFPKLPDLASLNPDLRRLFEDADKDARRRPGSADAVGKLGMIYHANLLLEQAGAAYRIASRVDQNDHRWAYALAVLEEEKGGGDEQLKWLQSTIRIKPDHVPALVKLGDWHFKLDQLDDAAKYYDGASRAPDGRAYLQATFGSGRVAARRHEWTKVVEVIEPLTRTYPHAAPLYELLEEAYAGLGQSDRAAQARQSRSFAKWRVVPPFDDAFDDQLIGYSYSSTRLLKYAGLMSRAGLADRAVDAGRRAVQADPKDADARNFLARTLLNFYRDKPEAVDEALAQVTECLRLKPEDPVPLGGFAQDFFNSPKSAAAVQQLRALLRAHSNIPGVHLFLGEAADALDETAEAGAEYRAALNENPKNSSAHNKLGLIAERQGKAAEAEGYFRKAIQLNPENTAARLNLAIEVMQQGNYMQGFKELDALLKIDPHDAAAHFCKGFAFLSMHRLDEAIARFREGLLYEPDDAEAHFGLGSALAGAGKRDEARAELLEALRLSPNHKGARGLMEQIGN